MNDSSRPAAARVGSDDGFSLIELVVVVAIMSILAGVIVPQLTGRQAAARDARRLADLHVVIDAIEQYYAETHQYPAADKSAKHGGWDVSHDGNFISELVTKGYLRTVIGDPINDETHHFRYYVYDQGSYGCAGPGPYYVIGIRTLETPRAKADSVGYFKCAQRDWSTEFDYVTGGGATYE